MATGQSIQIVPSALGVSKNARYCPILGEEQNVRKLGSDQQKADMAFMATIEPFAVPSVSVILSRAITSESH